MNDRHLHMSDGVCWHYTLVMNVQHAFFVPRACSLWVNVTTGGSRCLDCDIIHCAPCPRTVIVSGAVFSSLMTLPHAAPLALPLRPPPEHGSHGQEPAQSLRQMPDCVAVWPNSRHSHEKSEGSNAGGRGDEGGRGAGANLSLGVRENS